MTNYTNIEIEIKNYTATLWLNRPDRHNALDPNLMREVIQFLEAVENDDRVRIVVFRGNGKSFCAGADLNWMKEAATLTPYENLQECLLLSEFFSSIYRSRKVTISIAHGNIFGGGNGIIAASDISYGLNDCRFSLSETRLGLIAASITPYLLKRLKPSDYKELIFTARIFDGQEAEQIGLLNRSFESTDDLESYLEQTITNILKAGPKSLIGSKQIINNLTDPINSVESLSQLPKILADVRISDEAKEGFSAFLEKRKPNW